jgi:transcriptional antiterminator RfaH
MWQATANPFSGQQMGNEHVVSEILVRDENMVTDPATAPQWFAIQTKVSREKIAVASLHRHGLETLLPLRRCNPSGWRARNVPFKALFPGYLFAFLDIARQLRAAAHARGVVRVVSAGERPLPLDSDIIEGLRGRMDSTGCVQLDTRSFRPGESVRIIAGPLAGWQGAFDSALSDAERVVILLETLHEGRLIVRTDWVERLAAA